MPRRAVLIFLIALFSLGLLSIRPAFSETAKETAVLQEMRLLHEQTLSAAEKASTAAEWAKTVSNTALTVTGIILGIVAIFGIAFTVVYTRRIRDLTDEAKDFRDLAEKSMEKTEGYMERAAKVTIQLEERREDIEKSIKEQVGHAVGTIKAEVDKAVRAEVERAIEDLDRREKEAVAVIDEQRDRATEFGQFFAEGLRESAQGHFEAALKAYEKSIELDPNNAFAWTNKGVALRNLGRYEDALDAHEIAIELEPNNAPFWTNKGAVLIYLDRPREALSSCEKATNLDPEHASAWFNKACAHSKLGQKPKMLDALKRAIELDPEFREKAKTDEDFEPYRSDADFQELVGEDQ